MIDCWDYENRLVERIAVREAAAACLTPRERRIINRHFCHDETLKNVGAREGIGGARTAQIVNRSIRKLQYRLAPRPEPALPKPSADLRVSATPPPGWFEEFRAHMVALKARKAAEAQATFERERRALDDMLAREAEKKAAQAAVAAALVVIKAQAKAAVYAEVYKPPPPPWLYLPVKPPPTVQAVEPWFDPAVTPTHEHLKRIGLYALNYFCAARKYEGWGNALQRLGDTAVQVVCARDADAIAAGMMRLHHDLPAAARLSAIPLAVPDGMLGVVMASTHAALRLISYDAGTRVSIELTWDLGG